MCHFCWIVRCPEDSEFSHQVEEAIGLGAENIELEHCRLLPQTARELQLMLDSCMYAKTKFNTQVSIASSPCLCVVCVCVCVCMCVCAHRERGGDNVACVCVCRKRERGR